jgi:hypothetical protein
MRCEAEPWAYSAEIYIYSYDIYIYTHTHTAAPWEMRCEAEPWAYSAELVTARSSDDALTKRKKEQRKEK